MLSPQRLKHTKTKFPNKLQNVRIGRKPLVKEKEIERCIVSDHVAKQVLEMAKKFYSNPENMKKYAAWYQKTYGCQPKSKIHNY